VFSALACNDFEIIEHFLPRHSPLLDGSHYLDNMMNIMHLLCYGGASSA